jgi:hypothetical protein
MDLVAIRSTINQNSIHSAIIRKGEYQSRKVPNMSILSLLYINNAKTKFIQPHINAHLIQKGMGIFNTRCLSNTPKIHTIAQRVIYQNNKPNLSKVSASVKTRGIRKNADPQKIKPIVFHIAILFSNLDSNNFIINTVIK